MRFVLPFVLMLASTWSLAQTAASHANDAEEFYEKGKYDLAARECCKALRIKDNHRKSQEYLQLSWNAYLNQATSAIRMAEMSAADLQGNEQVQQYQVVVDWYKKMTELRNECTSLPPIVSKATDAPLDFGTNDFLADWQAARAKLTTSQSSAAEYHYGRGTSFEGMGDIDNARLAAREFKLAAKNSPGYKDAQVRYETNRAKATKRLAIIPFENNSGQGQYGAVQDLITDWVIATIVKDDAAMEFTDIITRDELQVILNEQRLSMSSLLDESTVVESGALLGVHQIVTGRINQISCDGLPVISTQYEQSANCVTGYKTAYNKNGKPYQQPVYGVLGARVTEYRKETKFRINGSYKMLDVRSGQLLNGDTFTEEVPWSCTWGTYSGNECALSREAKDLVTNREQNPPTCNELVNQGGQKLAAKLGSRVASAIR